MQRRRRAAGLVCVVLVALTGCASTKVETTGATLQEPLCKRDGRKAAALVYWGPQWRPDQKEPERRETAALRGIESFLASSECLARFDVRRLPGASTAQVPPDGALLKQASAAVRADKVLVIVVRELGPILRIGIPSIVEGATEVVLELRLLDVPTSTAQANVRTHWWNGGTFVIKGVGSLERDMYAALSAALTPAIAPR